MRLPTLTPVKNKIRVETVEWKGLNRMPVVASGEILSMTNMYSEFAPCLTPRPSREVTQALTSGTSIFVANGKFCWVDGTDFYYDGTVKGAVTAGRKSMCVFNGKIIIVPDKKYYDYGTGIFGTISNCPDLDYVCVFNNRIVGVKGNDFRMSALGEYNVWEDYSGESNDSWATDTAEEGDFTGLLGLKTPNHIICTKANYLYELYGTKPSNFNLTKIDDTGCIDSRSLVAIDNVAYFLSREGIMQYAGGSCKNISITLQETYVSGAAGTDGRRYYISLYNGTEINLYVYDTYNGLWHREDALEVISFVNIGREMYALTNSEATYSTESILFSYSIPSPDIDNSISTQYSLPEDKLSTETVDMPTIGVTVTT
jgi:hypothetical protein